jgi:hypothetical protein
LTWPDALLHLFEVIPRDTTIKADWYVPYNSLLNLLFSLNKGYVIAPQYKGPDNPGSIYFTTIYVMERN